MTSIPLLDLDTRLTAPGISLRRRFLLPTQGNILCANGLGEVLKVDMIGRVLHPVEERAQTICERQGRESAFAIRFLSKCSTAL